MPWPPAARLTPADLATFDAALQLVAQQALSPEALNRSLAHDGPLPAEYFNAATVAQLDAQVWGQGFEAPLFCDEVDVLQQRLVADKHLKLRLRQGSLLRDAIWFGRTEPLPARTRLALPAVAGRVPGPAAGADGGGGVGMSTMARWLSRQLMIFIMAVMPALPALAAPRVEVVARGLVNPWAVAFLHDGRWLVTERPGRMRIIAPAGKLGAPLPGLPPVYAQGQGGLLDVVLDPQFASNTPRLLELQRGRRRRRQRHRRGPGPAGRRARQRAPGRRSGCCSRQMPKVSGSLHFGGRLVFGQDGRLFITLGDRFSRKDDAQNLANHLGKVVRIEPDGKVPADNPFASQAGARPEIWSYGHRNVQGAAIHPTTGALWTTEHGPQGGDELNITLPGKNHGWPVITAGRNYVTGTKIGDGTERADVAAAVTTWLPTSIAPSGMAFLTSDRYPGWKGQLFIGALRGESLLRLQLEGRRVVQEERLLKNLNERIRDVRQGPDGWLYLLTDNPDGRLLRLLP